jgi:hypothetical protein
MEPEHGFGGTRHCESANYEGMGFVCLCGEPFVDLGDLEAHVREENAMCSNCDGDYQNPELSVAEDRALLAELNRGIGAKCEHIRVEWNVAHGRYFCLDCPEIMDLPEIDEALRSPGVIYELAGAPMASPQAAPNIGVPASPR